MIRALCTMSDGKTLLLLGLSKRNVELIQEGKPILFDGKPFGFDGNISICYGETETKIAEDLGKAGFEADYSTQFVVEAPNAHREA